MTPDEHIAEAERVYSRVYDVEVYHDSLRTVGIKPGSSGDTDKLRQALQLQLMADAQYHTTMAVAKMIAEFPLCGHGVRGFCPHCLRVSFIEMGFDQPRH